jgi:hypothetical protein
MARAPSVLTETAPIPGFAAAAGPSTCRTSRRISGVLIAIFIAAGGFSRGSEDLWRQVHFLVAAMAIPYLALGHGALLMRSLRLCWPMLLFVVLGLCVTVAEGALFERDTLKGLWYATRIPVYVSFGILLTVRMVSPGWITDVLLLAGAILAFHFLYMYYTDPNVADADRLYIRSQIGHGALASAFAIVLAFHKLFIEKKVGVLSGLLVVGAIIVMATSIILSDSRSHLYEPAILLLFIFGVIPSAWFGRTMALLFLIALAILTTPALQFFVAPGDLDRLSSALPDSLNELIAMERADDGEINTYWRGYETFNAFSLVTQQGYDSILFGLGLHGAVTIPNTPLDLGDPVTGAIPLFHNGFAFAYVRAGLLGIALFIWQHLVFASESKPLLRSRDPGTRFFGRLYCGLMMLMIIKIATTTGFLNYGEEGSTSCILLGLLIGFAWNICGGLTASPLVPAKSSKLPVSIG